MIALRILHIVSALAGGGVESSVMGSYRILAKDGIIFDFAVFTDRVGMLEDEAKSYGSKIYHIPSKRESYKRFLKSVRDIMKNGNYDAIHCHLAEKGFWFYYFAKKYGKKCIMHTHGCWNKQSFLGKLKKNILVALSSKYCDMYCSCSMASAKYVFGKDYKKSNIINNAFKTERFLFSQKDRDEVRKSYNIKDNDFLIGAVGRLSAEKNQGFLIKILSEILKKRKTAKLMLVGNGAMKSEWEEFAKRLKISDSVIFTGNVKNPEKYYSAFDAFCLPSVNEGFGMALVEAQINGLRCFASNYITDEAIVKKENVSKIVLGDEKKWAEALTDAESGYERNTCIADFEQFSVEQVSRRLISLYNKLL